MTTWLQDFRYGARLLGRAPGFTLVAVAALAIGVGSTTAIFSVVNTLMLQPLPYRAPERLAVLWEHNLPRDQKANVVAPVNFIHWREMNRSFEDLAAFTVTLTTTLTGAGEPEDLSIVRVTASFFPLLGVSPALGRTITPDEDRPDSHLAVISDRLWKRRFGADPGLLRRTIVLNGEPYTVIGVMPAGFSFFDRDVDVWEPMGFTASARIPRGRGVNVIGRLKPGVELASARQEMTRIAAQLKQTFPDFNAGWTARVVPLREQLTGNVRPALFVLLGAVGFVLLIACANVANLLLARATTRQRELALRAALGAGRVRLVRQLLAESLLLALAGGAAGLALAFWAVRLIRVVAAERLPVPRLETVGIDGTVLAFTLGASVLSGLLFGLVPALTASATGLAEALKEGGRTGSAAHGVRTRGTFVVVEIALALMLLVGAGLLVRSFARLVDVNPGFETAQAVTMRVNVRHYPEDAQRVQFVQRILDRIASLPGVQSAGGTSYLPLTPRGGAAGDYLVVGEPDPPREQRPVADMRVVARDYFRAMGVPLLRGRVFDDRDPADLKGRIIVNETLARRHWPGRDPIGQKVRVGAWGDFKEDEIIGVVADVRLGSLDTAARATVYWPHARVPYATMTLAIRTTADPTGLVRTVVGLIREQDPNLAVADVQTMEEVVAASLAQRRLTMMLLAMFAGAAVLLAAVGIHGVIGYSVTQRTQEIGIRMALGAQRGDVLRMVVGQALGLAAIGIVIGAVGARFLSRLMEGLLFDVTPADPWTYAAVMALLGGVAALAAWLPGRRATRVDPVVALRAE